MAEVVILGAGVMGSAMAVPAARSGARIALVGTHLDDAIIRSVAGNGHHPRLGLSLPSSVTPLTHDRFGEAMTTGADLLVLGVASAGVDWAIDRIVEAVRRPVPILMITKGLAPRDGTIRVLPEVVHEEIRRRTGLDMPIMAVGGPCIAGELAAERDTAVVITGRDAAEMEAARALLSAPFYHARLSRDVVGVEVCAAFKNFFAIAVGAVKGRLETEGKARNGALMHNLAASLFTQAIEEMQVLVAGLGGDPATAAGLAGAGDLYVTCQAGRNGRMGRLLGLGLPFSRAKAEHMTEDTVEGANLALELGPTLEAMMSDGRLPAERLPLARAILAAVTRDAKLDLPFATFHRG
jgi:glycerol-3-phosphate dehydrogenase (NAD(P)+)